MSTTPKQPCSPPLNLVPNGTAGSAFPPPLDSSDIPNVDSNPGFGDFVTQMLGDAGDVTDGFDQVVSDVIAVADDLDLVQAANDAELDTILSLLDAADQTPANSAFSDFTNQVPTGQAIFTAAQGLTIPDLQVLPLALTIQSGTPNAVVPQNLDVGQIKLGSPPFVYFIGRAVQTGDQYNGVSNVQQENGDPAIFALLSTDTTSQSGAFERFTWSLQVTPAKTGKYTAQYAWINGTSIGIGTPYLLTVTVEIVP